MDKYIHTEPLGNSAAQYGGQRSQPRQQTGELKTAMSEQGGINWLCNFSSIFNKPVFLETTAGLRKIPY